ncbi:cutinase family protein [Nocardia jejuensis]|uniref:cutinase family protein n=1 Tax=Nocardia jejuensis TaxID=328049 RepID=UPI000AD0F87A|nr:cutinase family protein [Nocardia jejuensis]
MLTRAYKLTRARIRTAALLVTVCGLTVASIGVAMADNAPSTQLSIDTCPALYALGVQGTGESSPDAAVSTDTGMLSAVFRPMLADASDAGLVDRAYVPYEASFGGAVASSLTPYSQSVDDGLTRLESMAKQVVDRCPNTRLALAGYSQGAHVVSLFAQKVGASKGAVTADKVAGVALFGDPTRNSGSSLFPGAAGKTAPDAAPGTQGTAVAALTTPMSPDQPATGAGIGTDKQISTSFGTLAGRVASFCTSGDLACDAPTDSPLVRTVANLASQVELSGGDPIASLKSIVDAVAYTSIKTFTSVVNNDISGTTVTDLSISSQKSISERIADASNPATSVNLPGALQALVKIGTIAFNSVIAVVKNVLTVNNIAEIATAGLANPLAGLAVLGTKVVSAVVDLVPPTTISKLTGQAYTAIVKNVTDNKDLLDITTWARYWNTAQKHDYTHAQGAGFGDSPAQYAGAWFAALAHDLASTKSPGDVPRGGSDKPSSGLDFGPTTTAPTTTSNGQFPLGGEQSGATTSAPPLTTTSAPELGGFIVVPTSQPQVLK